MNTLRGASRSWGRLWPAAIAAALTLSATPAGAGGADLQPERLPRGADTALPHVEGNTIVDGRLQIPVEGGRTELLAVAASGYVVRTQVTPGVDGYRVLEVSRDGSTRVLVRRGASHVTVDTGGTHLAWGSLVSDGTTALVVTRIRDGRRVARRVVGYPGGASDIIDFSGRRLLLGRSRSGQTLVWNWSTNHLRTVAPAHRWLHAGNLRADVFSAFRAGDRRCTVVARISRPEQHLWSRCGERVIAISDDGRRLATTERNRDPRWATIRHVRIRTIHGRLLGDYTSSSIDQIQWESPRRVLFTVQGDTHTSTVRCTPRLCKNASDPVAVPVEERRPGA